MTGIVVLAATAVAAVIGLARCPERLANVALGATAGLWLATLALIIARS